MTSTPPHPHNTFVEKKLAEGFEVINENDPVQIRDWLRTALVELYKRGYDDGEPYCGKVDCPCHSQKDFSEKQHDCMDFIDKAIRVGRASYACSECGKDVSLAWFFYQQAIEGEEKIISNEI